MEIVRIVVKIEIVRVDAPKTKNRGIK